MVPRRGRVVSSGYCRVERFWSLYISSGTARFPVTTPSAIFRLWLYPAKTSVTVRLREGMLICG